MAAIRSSQVFVNPQEQHLGFQGTEETISRSTEAESAASLLVRHLPEAIPHDTLSRLFSHYGASAVRPCSGGRLRSCAFVDFKNEALASQAQRQLHGLRFLGKVLSVQRASKQGEDNTVQKTEAQVMKDFKQSTSTMKDAALTRDISSSSKTGSVFADEPIAARLGVEYPFPPHLEYAYPPPDGNILTNIVNALIAVPRFYTQVLHLMNKMNIPAPFRMALPTPPLPPSAPAPLSPPPPPSKPNLADLSSGESEMESSDDEVDAGDHSLRAAKHGKKRARPEAILGPAVDKDVVHEAVGVKSVALMPKERPIIKKKNPVLQIKISHKVPQIERKDESGQKENSEEPNKENSGLKAFATQVELENGKLPPEEILSLPMFKNYMAGNPAPVLYIKNLAKDVVPDDFYYIFGSVFGSNDAARSGLSMKLMQEGRMRGQAFVTFPSTELAHHALNLVNGFVFKGKPMIIQFGRNPAAAKAN